MIALSQLSHRATDGYFKPLYRELAPEYYDNDYALSPSDMRIMQDIARAVRDFFAPESPSALLPEIPFGDTAIEVVPGQHLVFGTLPQVPGRI